MSQYAGPMTTEGLEGVIAEFRKVLPGWWFTIGDCYVSADSSVGPDPNAPLWPGYDIDALISIDQRFDSGFHCDIKHPFTMAQSMRINVCEAKAALNAALNTLDARSSTVEPPAHNGLVAGSNPAGRTNPVDNRDLA